MNEPSGDASELTRIVPRPAPQTSLSLQQSMLPISEEMEVAEIESFGQLRQLVQEGLEVTCRELAGGSRLASAKRVRATTPCGEARLFDEASSIVPFSTATHEWTVLRPVGTGTARGKVPTRRDGSAIWLRQLQTCHRKGQDARVAGISQAECPYNADRSGVLNIQRRHWWMIGWQSTSHPLATG